MKIIEFLQKSLEGRGFYPIFMVIYSWSNAVILFAILIYEIYIYFFNIIFKHKAFKNKTDNKKKQ